MNTGNINRRQTILNASMAVAQVCAVGAAYFFIYAFLLRTIGVEKVGIWSLVMASASVNQVANFGLSASVIKFVAKYAARDEHVTVTKLLQTALISVSIFVALLLSLFYPLAKLILPTFLEPWAIPDALSILPFAMISVWLMATGAILNGGLGGYQRIDLCSISAIVGTLLYTGLCFSLVGELGLMGLAYAHALRYVAELLISFLLLRRVVSIPLLPRCWDKGLFKEMIGYGASFQLITVITILCDPLTKGLLSRFGGLASVGYFEMASRLVMQIRGLIISANQVLVPVIADLVETAPGRVTSLYLNSYRVVLVLAIPIYTLLVVTSPLISIVWIGQYQAAFVDFTLLLSAGWLINTLSGPAYITYVGEGRLKWATISHVIMGVLNVGLGTLLGWIFGGIGVVVGWTVALVVGSGTTIAAYHVEGRLPWRILLQQADLRLLVYSTAVLIVATLSYSVKGPATWAFQKAAAITALFAIVTFIALRRHPTGIQLRTWMTRRVPPISGE